LYRTAPLIILVLALSSCGSGSSTTPKSTVSEKTVKSKETAPATTKPVKQDTSGEACQDRLGDFLDRMNDLRQSLLAGLSYDEYVVRVRAIRDAYEAVPVDKLGASCVTGPAAKAEDALNQYLLAANAWGECAATAGCAASEVEGKLQKRWKQASNKLDAAEKPS
jgi:hypothetical protein